MTKPYRSRERSPQELSYALIGELHRAHACNSTEIIHGQLQLHTEAFTGTDVREFILRTCPGEKLRSTLELMQNTLGNTKCPVDHFIDFILEHKSRAKLLRRIGHTDAEQICVIGTQQFERRGKKYYPIAWYDINCAKEIPTLVKVDDLSKIGPNILCVTLHLKI